MRSKRNTIIAAPTMFDKLAYQQYKLDMEGGR